MFSPFSQFYPNKRGCRAHFSSSVCSQGSSFFPQLRDKLTKTNGSPTAPRGPLRRQELWDGGEAEQRPRALLLLHRSCSSTAGGRRGGGLQVAGNDGYRRRCVIVHPFESCSRCEPSTAHCRADPRCLLRKSNARIQPQTCWTPTDTAYQQES